MALPYMPLYLGDYLRDTIDLTATEHGAYLLLLLDLWNNDGEITADPTYLCTIARVDRRAWPKVWRKLAPKFVLNGDRMLHKRVHLELAKARKKSEARAQAGAKGGRTKSMRYKGDQQANATPDNGNSQPQPASKTLASQSQSQNHKASKLALAGQASLIDRVRAAIGPAVLDPDDCGIDFAVEYWQGLGATDDEIVGIVRRQTADPRPKPIKKLRALNDAIEDAIASRNSAAQKSAQASAPIILDEPEGEAGECFRALVAARGERWAQQWLSDVAWNGHEVYAPSEFSRQRIESDAGGILREHGYTVVS